MFELFENLTNWLWGLPLLITILATGVYLTVRSGFFQFRHFGYIVKNMFSKERRQEGGDDGKSLTPFQAISIAIGGTVGVSNMSGVATAMRLGFARSVYSNEAGWGTSPMIHASAKTDHPVKQGLMGAFEVFADTIVVCSMTGLVVITTGYWNSGLQGSELTLTAFESGMGSVARALIAISIFLFGLTTSTGWFTYYSVILKHWLKNNQKVLKIAEKVFILGTPLWGLLVTVLTLYGNGTPAQLWVIADFTTVFPTFVNVATLFILSGTFFKLLKDYKARYMGIGKVDKDMALFYEDKKEKEEK